MAGRGQRLRVLPDGARVDDAMVRAARTGPGFVDGSGWMTFGQLVDALSGAGEVECRPCTPLHARVVVWAAARKLGPGPFGTHVHQPAFARAALGLFSDLKAGGLPPPAFQEAVAHFPAGRIERAKYLSRLYGEYDRQLLQQKRSDREDEVLLALASLKKRGLPPSLASVQQIEISGLHDFPPSRRQLLLELARQCDRAGVRFVLELPAGCSAEVDAAVDPIMSDFERAAQSLQHVEVQKRDLTLEDRPLAALGRHLFGPGLPNVPPEKSLPLEMIQAATARHEARTLARIAHERISEGVPPEQIAIAWPELGDEANWTNEALEALGIPARIRRGLPLQATAIGRLALDLPLLVDDGFPAARIAELVGSRYAPAISRGLSAVPSPAALLAEAGARDDRIGAEGEKGAYEVRLSALARRLEAQGNVTRRNQVAALLDGCRKLIRLVSRIPEEGRAADMLARWEEALDELGLPKALREPPVDAAQGSSMLGVATLRALARDQLAYEALRSMARELGAALRESGAAGARIERRTFYRWLVDSAQDFNLAARGPRGGAVHVLELRELAGRSFEHVFIGGLADGRFPGRDAPHPLFPEEDRQRVNERCQRDVLPILTGEGERRIPRRLAADRLLFHLVLSASTGRVTVSVSSESASGAEQVPSPFWDELTRRTGVVPRTAPLRMVPPLDDVRNERELRERSALELYAPAALRTEDPDPAVAELAARLGSEPWIVEAAALARIEDERLRFFGDPEKAPGPFSGDAARDDVQAALRACFRFDKERPLSASLLDRFGNCAFQGFAGYALGLREPDEPGEEIDPRGRGSFWHKVLEILFPLLKAEGLLGVSPDRIPDAILDQAIAASAAEVERKGSTGHPALWRIGQERARRMARQLLSSSTRGLPFEGLEPREVELEFGRPGAPERWREIAIPGGPGEEPVFIAGKIDRIDAGGSALAVVDYKSGSIDSAPKAAEALLESSFQVPLYLHAARVAGHTGELRGALVSLKNGKVLLLEEVLAKGGQRLEELLAVDPSARAELAAGDRKNLANAVHGLVAELRAGRFPARAADCTFCTYRRVCRITERTVPENGGNGS
ncbi:MAG TPA: PD-(D/E)XK nuclease family protein [Myxococcaceae bacterium]|nr:PD-(D/E)XK nuclease family protein [Myxococcaceae bacterium]